MKVLTPERARKYRTWVENSELARASDDLDESANQYDKAEEMLTWVTFAPLLRMDQVARSEILSAILEAHIEDAGEPQFEALLSPPKKYIENLKRKVINHPVRYIRLQSRQRGRRLEGPTHIDCLFRSRDAIVAVEAKFLSDISTVTRFDPYRNQLARIVDVLLEQPERDIYLLVPAPSGILIQPPSRLYMYKAAEYNHGRIKLDLPHRREEVQRLKKVKLACWSIVAGIIYDRAEKEGVLSPEEQKWAREFYEEREETI